VEESGGLLGMVGLKMRNKLILIWEAISRKSKLEITFRYLTSGYNLSPLQYLFRVPKRTNNINKANFVFSSAGLLVIPVL
jgi:hypothetical protein